MSEPTITMSPEVARLLIRQELALGDEGIDAKNPRATDGEIIAAAARLCAPALDIHELHELWDVGLRSDEEHQADGRCAPMQRRTPSSAPTVTR